MNESREALLDTLASVWITLVLATMAIASIGMIVWICVLAGVWGLLIVPIVLSLAAAARVTRDA